MSVTSTPEAWAETGFAAGESYAMAADPVAPDHAELYAAASEALSETEGAPLATPYERYCYTAAFIGAAEQYATDHVDVPDVPPPPADPAPIQLAGTVSAAAGGEA